MFLLGPIQQCMSLQRTLHNRVRVGLESLFKGWTCSSDILTMNKVSTVNCREPSCTFKNCLTCLELTPEEAVGCTREVGYDWCGFCNGIMGLGKFGSSPYQEKALPNVHMTRSSRYKCLCNRLLNMEFIRHQRCCFVLPLGP